MGRHRKKQPKESTKQILNERKKLSKQKLKEKRARLVVKNLSFKATEENLREHFEQYGEIADVKVLKKEDGKSVGCAFIQFKLVQKAAKARHHLNGKDFLGRKVIVDFAVAKDKFKKEHEGKSVDIKTEIKQEPMEIEVKTEPVDEKVSEVINEEEDKLENTEGSKGNSNHDSEGVSVLESEDHRDHEGEGDRDHESEGDSDHKSELSELSQVESQTSQMQDGPRRPHVISNDVREGKTVFIKNVPFSATNDDLKECMRQFGPLYYALICVDRLTEHSKGTAFVKFQNQEDAEKALQAGTELTLLGNVLDCHPAVDKNELMQKAARKKEEGKHTDSRNLYLIKEGVILAGTKAAQGVSASDMGKRLQLEQYKSQILRNLNMFISRERLIVHNLPPTWDDKKLKTLFLKFAGKGAVIKEAKVMRDMKNIDSKGVGRSKEYGFVAFTKHEHALTALRALNNNPKIFSPTKRPIVAFSIENKTMVKAKLKRLENSKQKNPKSKDFDPTLVKTNEKVEPSDEQNLESYAGMAAKPGIQKMRNRYKLTTQAQLHYQNLKKEKKKQKMGKKTLSEKKKDFIKQPGQKINKKKESDNFMKLVNDYKQKLINAPVAAKTKWYN